MYLGLSAWVPTTNGVGPYSTATDASVPNISARDAEFEQRRRLCIGLFFPTVPEENLEEHLCRFTRMDDIDDVQKLRNDDRQVLELRASRIECMQKFFDDAPRGIRDRKYANLVKRVRALADDVMDTNRQASAVYLVAPRMKNLTA
ncbi:hypothetical protein MRX96_043887 [Rhipicephalus microplus]